MREQHNGGPLPPPALLLLFLSFPLLLVFPETSLCTAVARKDPALGNSGHSVPQKEVNCTVPCADAFHNNGTKPSSALSDSNSSSLVPPFPSTVPDGLNMSGPDDQTALKSGTVLSQEKATPVSSLPNQPSVSSRPLNATEPPNTSVKEEQRNVVPHSNDPLKDAITSMPSSTPPTKNLPDTASTSPSLIPRSNVLTDSAVDSIPVDASKQSSNTTAPVATSTEATSSAVSSSGPGSAEPNVSATAPSTNPTGLTLSQTPSPLTAAPPRTTTTTTTTNTPSTGTTTLIPTVVNKSPDSPSPAAAPQPKTLATTGAPVESSTPTTSPTTTAASAHPTAAVPARSGHVPIATPVISHLADTASLLAVLLLGLLFFLVTVALFVTQAIESYRRKDYTQVDYLINGMYTDSGV